MDEKLTFDEATLNGVIRRLKLRSILYAVLLCSLGISQLFMNHPDILPEIIFSIYGLLAFTVLGFGMLFEQRYKSGKFGTTPQEEKMILGWKEEENHWWGKPIF